jgi:hypothetical protein
MTDIRNQRTTDLRHRFWILIFKPSIKKTWTFLNNTTQICVHEGIMGAGRGGRKLGIRPLLGFFKKSLLITKNMILKIGKGKFVPVLN